MIATILYSVENRICTITLNRPDKRNAFDGQLIKELHEAFMEADKSADVKVVILKGEGVVFSAGADLGYLLLMQSNSYEENLADSTNLKELYKFIYTMSKPVIAQIEGHAIAGGCGLAAVCDLAYSVPEAQFGYTEVLIGFVPAIVMFFLLRKIGERNATELLITGKLIPAKRAKEIGLINNIIPASLINEQVKSIANEIIKNCSGASLKVTKQMIASIQEMTMEKALEFSAEMNAQARGTSDCKKGIQAFLNKTKPEW